ncbi:hypothetical protein [uncultured Rikenella sp.]|nr:hypothetical protein [uncultured Rikenella sp.]
MYKILVAKLSAAPTVFSFSIGVSFLSQLRRRWAVFLRFHRHSEMYGN